MAAGYNRFGPGDLFGGNIRVGDAEREAVAAQLREHYADGRLTLDELNERLDLAFAARTRADVASVTRDLPRSGLTVSGAARGAGGASGTGDGAGKQHASWSRRAGIVAVLPTLLGVWLLFVLGGTILFGLGGDKPLGVVFLLLALALLRRMFGRRRRRCGRRVGGCGRRW